MSSNLWDIQELYIIKLVGYTGIMHYQISEIYRNYASNLVMT